jgi:hypothetical protein
MKISWTSARYVKHADYTANDTIELPCFLTGDVVKDRWTYDKILSIGDVIAANETTVTGVDAVEILAVWSST